MNKQQKISIIVFLIGIGILISCVLIFYQENKDICDKGFGIIFLKPNEKHLISEILEDNPNIIVVVPEENLIQGNSEILNCPNLNFNPYDYLVPVN